MVPTDEPDAFAALTAKVQVFAGDIARTIEAVLPDVDGRFEVLASNGGRDRITLRQQDRRGLALCVEGQRLLRLVINYRCVWNEDGDYLAVEKSEFKVFAEQVGQPLIRFDYLRSPAANIPCAHVNVHAHRDEVVFAMMRSGPADRGRDRARTVAEGRVPSLRELHIPLGGHRFRPCVEDVLQMLIVEFGLDRLDGYERALAEGRRRYRVQQLRTAASDDLEEVADLLRERGYRVDSPEDRPAQRSDRLGAY